MELEWVQAAATGDVTKEFARRLKRQAAAQAAPYAVALTGGESAGVFYDAWAAQGANSSLAFYWSDERVVPLDSPDSNYKLAAERLLGPAHVAADRIHAAPVDLEPRACAAAYAALIRQQIGGEAKATPRFPLIILGLGTDGHTASLFPGRDPYQDDDLLVRAVEATPDHPHPRITFTPKLINAAAEVWFVITGKQKDWAVEELAKRTAPVRQVPSLTVDPTQTKITIFRG